MTQFSVPVQEYGSARPGSPMAAAAPFLVNERQLVIAMVRAVLTTSPGNAAKKLVAAVTWPTLRFMLDWHAAPRLQLSQVFSKGVRDFSLTSRIGELSQGLSCAYWKWERHYSWICDFGPWANGLHPKLPKGRAPDFVMWNALTNDLCVMEAKGTGGFCHKSAMIKALRQCNAALKHPAFTRGYGSVVTLGQSAIPAGRGTLHIRDPDTDRVASERTAYEVFRRSYATWFELIGDDEMAAWCRGDPNGPAIIRALGQINDKADWNSLITRTVMSNLGFDPNSTRFSIEPTVFEALHSFDAFRERGWLERISPGKDESTQMRFPDGTIIEQTG